MRIATALSVGLITVVATAAQPQPISNISKTIGLKCPAENGGTLEHVKVSSSGMSYRQQLTYIGGEPAILVAAEAKKDEPLRVHETTDLRTETDPSNVMFHHIVVRRLQMILQTACVGPADGRAKFLEQVKANRVALGLP